MILFGALVFLLAFIIMILEYLYGTDFEGVETFFWIIESILFAGILTFLFFAFLLSRSKFFNLKRNEAEFTQRTERSKEIKE